MSGKALGIADRLKNELRIRKQTDSLRTLILPNGNLVDFASNDYLGFAKNEELHASIIGKMNSHQKQNGSTGSRLLTGNSGTAELLEKKLSNIFKTESSLLFNSGYTANLAVLSSIPKKGDTIIYDELSHASIKDGVRLSLANRLKFKHNDLQDLERKIKIASGQVFIVVESIYSMDGDFCPLQELVALAEKYRAEIILDEAHSTGIIGKNGSGYASSLTLENSIGIRIHTFGKAMGVHGAVVCGSKLLTDYLINFARPFIYTTAFPPHSIVSIDCAFELLDKYPDLQLQLKNNITSFINRTKIHPSISKNRGSIQTVLIPGNQRVRDAAKKLNENGFDVRPILSPTVPVGKERLRICLHAFNTEEEIIKLVDILTRLG